MITPSHQRVIAGTPASVSWQQIDGLGEPADPGVVTVTISRADGTVIAAATATTGVGTAARTVTLTAAQTATLDRLTATWVAAGVTVATTEIDVVAAPWFANAELRAVEASVASEAAYPAAKVAAARLQVEAFFERCTGRRFSPGYTFQTVPGTGTADLFLPHPDLRRVRSAVLYDDLAGVAVETLAAGELAAFQPSPVGRLTRWGSTWSSRWVRVGWEWGLPAPPPDVRRQAMRLCRELLVNEPKGAVPDNAVNWSSTELGWSAVLVTPGVRGAHTRLPSVNECIDAWTYNEIGIA